MLFPPRRWYASMCSIFLFIIPLFLRRRLCIPVVLIISTQYPLQLWHKKLPDPTVADALCDRLIHKAYKFELGGESMRKSNKKTTKD
jgi:DNA replication protein DnaC